MERPPTHVAVTFLAGSTSPLGYSSGQRLGFTNPSYLEDSGVHLIALICPSNASLWKERVGAKTDAVDKYTILRCIIRLS